MPNFSKLSSRNLGPAKQKIEGDDWDGSKLTKYDRCIEPKARKRMVESQNQWDWLQILVPRKVIK
jgi:hypothetical protein